MTEIDFGLDNLGHPKENGKKKHKKSKKKKNKEHDIACFSSTKTDAEPAREHLILESSHKAEKPKSKKHKHKRKHYDMEDFSGDLNLSSNMSKGTMDDLGHERKHKRLKRIFESQDVLVNPEMHKPQILVESNSSIEKIVERLYSQEGEKKHKKIKEYNQSMYHEPEFLEVETERDKIEKAYEKKHKKHKKHKECTENTETNLERERGELTISAAKKDKKHNKSTIDNGSNKEGEDLRILSEKKKIKHKKGLTNSDSNMEMEIEKSNILSVKKKRKKKKHKKSNVNNDSNTEMEEEESRTSFVKKKKKHKKSIVNIDNNIDLHEEESKTSSVKKKKKHKKSITNSDSNTEKDKEESRTSSVKKKKHKKSIVNGDSNTEMKEEESRTSSEKKKKKHKKSIINSDNNMDLHEEESKTSSVKEKKKHKKSITNSDSNTEMEEDNCRTLFMKPRKKPKKIVNCNDSNMELVEDRSEKDIERIQSKDNSSGFNESDIEKDTGRNAGILDIRSENEHSKVELRDSERETGQENGEKIRPDSEKKNKKIKKKDQKQKGLDESDTEIQKNDGIMTKQRVESADDGTSDEEYQNLLDVEREKRNLMHSLNLVGTQVNSKKLEPKGCTDNGVDQNTLDIIHKKNDVSYRNYKKDLAHYNKIGLKIKSGKWTYKEDEQLRKNWRIFFEEHPFPEENRYCLLAARECTREELDKLRLFKSAYNFYKRLGEGIQRMLYSVYVRARYLFNPIENKGKFTESETKELESLTKRYSCDWKMIGESMNRSALAVSTKFSQIKEDRVKGKWSRAERHLLINAVKETIGTKDIKKLFYDLPWTKIAEQIPTRNPLQCRWYWLNKVQWLVNSDVPRSNKFKGKFTKHDQASLISLITDTKPGSEAEIDWLFLMERFENAGSPQYIKAKWYKLRQKVPNYKIKSFDEILDYLVETVLPRLKNDQV